METAILALTPWGAISVCVEQVTPHMLVSARMWMSAPQASMSVEIMHTVPIQKEGIPVPVWKASQRMVPSVKILTSVKPCLVCVEQSLCVSTLLGAMSATAPQAWLGAA